MELYNANVIHIKILLYNLKIKYAILLKRLTLEIKKMIYNTDLENTKKINKRLLKIFFKNHWIQTKNYELQIDKFLCITFNV